MRAEILFLIGTVASWAGFFFAFKAVSCLFRFLFRSPGTSPSDMQRGMIINGLVAGGLLAIGLLLPKELGREVAGEGLRVPLTWVLMPFPGWGLVVSGVMLVTNLIRAWLGINASERRAKLEIAGLWALAAMVFFYLWRRVEGEVQIFRGSMPVSASFVVTVVSLAIATMAIMAWISRTSTMRGAGKTLATHAALLVGSIIFGIPFAWLLVNSFKEDKDIANADALRWTPYVTRTVPFNDPDDPLFQAKYKGTTVEATSIGRLSDGRMQFDIQKPLGLRGTTFTSKPEEVKEIPKQVPVVTGAFKGTPITGIAIKEIEGGERMVQIVEPTNLKGQVFVALSKEVKDVKDVGLRWQNYPDALDFLPAETNKGLVYLKNTLILVIFSVIGTVVSCTLVAYAFARLKFYGSGILFTLLMATMMLPGAVTMLPQFLIYRNLGWVDTLLPLWVPSFFAGAFNVFLLRQFLMNIPNELEDAAKIDGCSYPQILGTIMVPQIKPALAAISIWTTMGAWNNFMGPLIYVSSPEKMPIAYALQLYSSSRGGEPGLLMAFTVLSILPVILLFFFAQRYFIEGVTLSGLGGR
jgi:multiple sugar transport system permease protein